MVLATKARVVALLCAGSLVVLAACTPSNAAPATSAPQENPALNDVLPPDVALSVRNKISEMLGTPVENIQIKAVEKTDWPDACLGLPKTDELCAEVVTPGWLLTFSINGQEYRYRVDQTGTNIRQER